MNSLKLIVIIALVAFVAFADDTEQESKCDGMFGTVDQRADGASSWAHATIAFIERAYCLITCSRIRLSVDRATAITTAACAEYRANDTYKADVIPCALDAIARDMALTPNPWIPIAITGARRICADGDVRVRLACAIANVRRAPLIATICDIGCIPDYDGELFDKIECAEANRVIVVTSIYPRRGGMRIVFQNTRGANWGLEGGGYVTISVENILNERDPLFILGHIYTANVSASAPEERMSAKQN
jgi:hypothetical protein